MSNGLHRKDPESLMREAAESFTAIPGEDVWAGIEQAIRKKDKRKRFVWFFVLPVLLIPAILLMGKPFQTKEHAAHTATEQNTNAITENKTNSENKISQTPVNTTSSPATQEATTQQVATNSNTSPITNHQSPVTTNQSPAQNIQPAIQKNKPSMAAVSKTANHFTADNNNDAKPLAKRSNKITRNKISQSPTEPETLIADVPVKQEDENETAPVTTAPNVPAETIETKKQEPVETAIAQRIEPEKISEPEKEATPPVNNVPEMIRPVNPKSDALNPKTVFPTVTVELPRRKFKLGFTVSAGGGYRLLTTDGAGRKGVANSYAVQFSNADPGKAFRKLNHRPAFVFSAGLIASQPLSQKWSLEAGLEYQMLGYNMPAYKTSPWQVNYTSGGVVVTTVSTDLNSRYVSDPAFATTSVAGTKTLKNQYHFINVPVTAVYESNPFGKRSFYVKAGVSVSYLLNKDAYIYSAESGRYFISPNPETYRNLNLAGVLEGGVRLLLKNNNELRVGMNFSFNALPTHDGNITLREHLYQSGIKISYLLR